MVFATIIVHLRRCGFPTYLHDTKLIKLLPNELRGQNFVSVGVLMQLCS